jgi:hypothetical protein
MLGKQSTTELYSQLLMNSLLTSSWLLKNKLWTWNMSLQRESSQPVLDLLLCVETFSSFSDSVCGPLFCLIMCVIWYLAIPTTISFLCGERTRFFCYGTRVVHAGQLLYVNCWDVLIVATGGQCPLLKLWPCSVSYLCEKNIALYSARLSCAFLGNSDYKNAVGRSTQTSPLGNR